MYQHNYKNLPYKESTKQFIKDYKFRYFLYGKYSKWKTKQGKTMVFRLNKIHLKNIVEKFGNTTIRTAFPFVWYRYLKEFEENK